jgi:hypothetical protein
MAISDNDRGNDRDDAPPAPFVPDRDGAIAAETTPHSADPAFETPAQLDLGEDDVRLPWLEGDDDFVEERGGLGQGALLVMLGVLALAVIGGSVFWLTRGNGGDELVADGGVIEAPKEPYKVRPDQPGGEVVAGTGDTSFAVAEGERRSPRIGGSESPAPGFDSVGKPDKVVPPPSASASQTPPAAGGIGVQVGAYASKEKAEAGWATLKSQYAELGAVNHRVVQGQADIGTVYRLQAVAHDAAAARALCAGMRGAGLSCQVKN